MSSELINLFEKRKHDYNESTKKIIDSINDTVIAAICDFADIDHQESERIMWHEVLLVNTFISITGTLSYNLGEEITLHTGEKVIVDQKIADQTAKLISITLPLEIAESDSKEKVLEFLEQIEAEGTLDYLDTSLDPENDAKGDITDEEFLNDFIQRYFKEKSDFDLSDLSTEQRKSLHYSQISTKNKGNIH